MVRRPLAPDHRLRLAQRRVCGRRLTPQERELGLVPEGDDQLIDLLPGPRDREQRAQRRGGLLRSIPAVVETGQAEVQVARRGGLHTASPHQGESLQVLSLGQV